MSGLLGDILVGAATGGIRGQLYENQLEDRRLDEIAKQTRQESLARLRASLQGENYAQQHGYRMDEIGQRNKFAQQRDETNYNRGLSDYIDQRTGHRYSHAEIAKFGGNLPAGVISVAKYGERPARVPDWKKKHDFLAKIDPKLAAAYDQKMAGVSDKKSSNNLLMEPEKLLKIKADAYKSWSSDVSPDKQPFEQFFESNFPVAAGEIAKLKGKPPKVGTGKFRSSEDVSSAVDEFLSSKDPEAYALDAKAKLAPDQYSLFMTAITKKIGMPAKKKASAKKHGHKSSKKSHKTALPSYTLGDILGAMTRGGVKAARAGYHGLNYAGNKLGQVEASILDANNQVGRGLIGLGKYSLDRFKEAY